MILLYADPVTLTAIGLGISGLAAAGSTAASFMNRPKGSPQTPGVPAPNVPPSSQPAAPPPNLTSSPSFMSAAAGVPQVNQPGKTLLGS